MSSPAQERSKLRQGELSAIDKAVDLLSSEEVGRTQGPRSTSGHNGRGVFVEFLVVLYGFFAAFRLFLAVPMVWLKMKL